MSTARPTGTSARPQGPGPGPRPGQGAPPAPTRPSPTQGRPPAAEHPAARAPGTHRRVKLTGSRIDPWSAMKMSFLISVALGIAGVVMVAVLWMILSGMGVF